MQSCYILAAGGAPIVGDAASFCVQQRWQVVACIKKKFFRFSPRRCSEGCSASPPGGAVLSGSPPPPSESDTSHTSIKSKFHLKIIH